MSQQSEKSDHLYLDVAKMKKRAAVRAKLPKLTAPQHESLPDSFSLAQYVPGVFDQSSLGSCTANALSGVMRFMLLINSVVFTPSRLWIYLYEREVENPNIDPSTLGDTGADVADGCNYVQNNGVCSEDLFSYDITQFDTPPSAEACADAPNHKIVSYSQISVTDIKHYLLEKQPVLVAISVYQSFEDATNGVIPMPDVNNESLLGGHEIYCIGYDDVAQTYELVNSWGDQWGMNGRFTLPYAYMEDPNLCSELVVINV